MDSTRLGDKGASLLDHPLALAELQDEAILLNKMNAPPRAHGGARLDVLWFRAVLVDADIAKRGRRERHVQRVAPRGLQAYQLETPFALSSLRWWRKTT